jgi:dTDP-4-amino-4,6-dideoxygalactose transaminase
MAAIPPFDLTRQYATIGSEIETAVTEILASGKYIGGDKVTTFEQAFADYIGVPYAIACNSGTDALYLALRSLHIGPGDEVITTPFTFFATAETISAVGATPVFVDVDPLSYNLNLNQVEAAITPNTRAIVPVHLFGQPVDMTTLGAIAQAHDLSIIEDCAQATGATWKGQSVGSFGQVGCFSFFPTKNLGCCGDGGLMTTHDPDIAATARMLREHGSKQRYYHEAIGLTSRLDALQAAILTIKLPHLDQWNQQRQAIAHYYQRFLADIPGIIAPTPVAGGTTVWHQYVTRITAGPLGQPAPSHPEPRRDRVKAQLQAQGISTMVYYPVPLHQQAAYAHLGHGPDSFPVAEQLAQEVLALPMFPELTREEQDEVIIALKDCLVA